MATIQPGLSGWPMHEKNMVGLAEDAEATADERADPKSVSYWPNPGAMVSKRGKVDWSDVSRREHMRFLNSWFYGRLSGSNHLSFLGLAERAVPFFIDPPEGLLNVRERARTSYMFTAAAMFAALLSEVVGELRLPEQAGKLRLFWMYLDKWPEVEALLRPPLSGGPRTS